MARVFALLVAFVYVVIGGYVLFLFAAGAAMGGEGRRTWLLLAGLAAYDFGVAAVAVWYAIKPFAHGVTTLVALVSPAVLVIGAMIVLTVVSQSREKVADRQRQAAATEVWEEWPAPPGVFGIPFFFDGKPLVATRSGIVRSDDNGQTWTPLGGELDEWPLVKLWAQVGDALFAVVSRGLYRSDDGGASWKLLGVPWAKDSTVYWTESGLPRSGVITALVPDGSDLYLHTSRYVFRSGDLGESWVVAYQGEGARVRAEDTEAESLAVLDGTLLVGTGRGIYRSRDRGASWSHLDGFPDRIVPSVASDGHSLYAISYQDGHPEPEIDVLRSTDGGDSWQPVNRGLEGRPQELVGVAGTAMFLLTGWDNGGVFSLEARDTSWARVPMPGPAAYVPPTEVGYLFGVSGDRLFVLNPDDRLYRYRGR